MIFSVEETIDAPIDEVWRYLTETSLMQTWMPGLEQLRSHDGKPLSANSRLFFKARGRQRQSDVVAFRTCECIALRSTQGPLTATYTYGIEPAGVDGGTTRVTLDADCVAKGLAKVFAPLLRTMIRRADGGQLSRLKAVVTQS